MRDHNIKRVSRLTAILTQLQAKRMLTAVQLSAQFDVSIRTIYRDMKALEQAGIPVITVEGKGYKLMEGYKVPPVMFTEDEANALATLEQLVVKSTDASLRKEYASAISKVKAVLHYATKEKVDLLANRIAVSPALPRDNTTDSLLSIQKALTSYEVLEITYHSEHKDETTMRRVEPFALYYSFQESWLLIAYCLLRKDFRMFRLDRMQKIKLSGLHFQPHKLTLAQYLDGKKNKFTTPDIPLS